MEAGGGRAMADGDGGVGVGQNSPNLPPEPKKASVREPIAPSLGVDYPFPPHLEYAYPPPDGNILTNIVNALIAVPRFYTQVLHLMNKMNLPAPFRPAMPTPPLPPPAPVQPVPKRQAADLSSGESELESSEEDEGTEPNDGNELEVERKVAKKGPARKKQKREAILGPALDRDASHEAAGLKTIVVPKASGVIKKKPPVLQIKITPKASTNEVDSNRANLKELNQAEAAEQHEDRPRTASRQELEAGKLQASEMLSLPILKKYAPGNPARVLYLKNLAKDVVPDDLYFIFGAFFTNRTEAEEQLSIKLMQEGRMRGQAFVECPSTELAKVALAGTHGYVLKGKPMIVQYGRNPAVAKGSSSSGPDPGVQDHGS